MSTSDPLDRPDDPIWQGQYDRAHGHRRALNRAVPGPDASLERVLIEACYGTGTLKIILHARIDPDRPAALAEADREAHRIYRRVRDLTAGALFARRDLDAGDRAELAAAWAAHNEIVIAADLDLRVELDAVEDWYQALRTQVTR